MLSSKDDFNFVSQLPRHMSHGSPQVCKLVRAFATAEILGDHTPNFWGEVQMRGHGWDFGSHGS